ncbi:MAG: hypothetical protein JXA87_02675, partial [Thermoleophilia bacterium]|nr:hypothetical protein [Thermoleophilia bacterium]
VVHCKVMDKYGSTYKEWNLTKQWYSIDEVAFIDDTVWTDLDDDGKVDELFELGPSVNMVGTGHTFTVQVSGAKYVHILWDVNYNGLLDDVALLGKRADLKAAEGYVAVMSANQLVWVEKDAGDDVLPGQAFTTSLLNDRPDEVIYTRFADTALSGAEYWADKLGEDLDGNPMALDYISEVWSGLKGKNVYFYTNIGTCAGGILSNTPLPTAATGDLPNFVGVITDPTANPVLTDDMGKATVSIDSEDKGYQYVWAIADYLDNPQDGDPLRPWDAIDATDPAAPVNLFPDDGVMELRYDCTMKVWVADPTCSTDVRIYAQGAQQSDLRWANPVMDDPALNVDRIYVQVFDKFGNALEGYKVTFEIVGQGTTTDGTCDTYHPFAHFAYLNDDETTNETYETPNHDWYEVVPGPYPTVVEYLALDLDDPANMAAYMASNDIMHKAGVGDLNPFMNANWYWGLYGDAARADLSITPIPYASLPASMTAADKFGLDDKYDDDYAWGWTLDHEINFNFNAASAAYADLVLDETVGQIAAQLADPAVCHVTSIVNIKVYCPNGTLDKQFEITKIWSVDAPRLASLTLLVGPSATGPWSTAYGPTSVQPAYYMVLGYDQYGDPFSTTTNLCVRAASTGYSSLTDTGLTLTDGVYIGPLSASDLGTGVWNLLAFDDLDANNAPNLGETQSNLCTYTIQ